MAAGCTAVDLCVMIRQALRRMVASHRGKQEARNRYWRRENPDLDRIGRNQAPGSTASQARAQSGGGRSAGPGGRRPGGNVRPLRGDAGGGRKGSQDQCGQKDARAKVGRDARAPNTAW